MYHMQLRDPQLKTFLYGGPYPSDYPTGIEKTVMRKLQMLKSAKRLNDLKTPPSNHLEPLKGKLKGRWSIRINKQYRFVFKWDKNNQEATDVYFDDYH